MELDGHKIKFPAFSLTRLLRTCFGEGNGEKVCILIDLPNPTDVKDLAFLHDESLSIQNYGYNTFFLGFKHGVLSDMNWTGGFFFSFKMKVG